MLHKEEEAERKRRTPKILVADDVPENVKLLSAILSREEYDVATAQGGQEAFEKAKAIHPDLVLLDAMMPEMDGYEVARQLKQEPTTKDITVIMVTGADDDEDRARGFEAGADGFLSKPVIRAELLVIINGMFPTDG